MKYRKNLSKIRIKITKIYNEENMSDSRSVSSKEPKSENYEWVYEDNELIKNKYLNYPFDKWQNLIK